MIHSGSAVHSFIHNNLNSALYASNAESEALEAVARWSLICKIVSFKLRLKV